MLDAAEDEFRENRFQVIVKLKDNAWNNYDRTADIPYLLPDYAGNISRDLSFDDQKALTEALMNSYFDQVRKIMDDRYFQLDEDLRYAFYVALRSELVNLQVGLMR